MYLIHAEAREFAPVISTLLAGRLAIDSKCRPSRQGAATIYQNGQMGTKSCFPTVHVTKGEIEIFKGCPTDPRIKLDLKGLVRRNAAYGELNLQDTRRFIDSIIKTFAAGRDDAGLQRFHTIERKMLTLTQAVSSVFNCEWRILTLQWLAFQAEPVLRVYGRETYEFSCGKTKTELCTGSFGPKLAALADELAGPHIHLTVLAQPHNNWIIEVGPPTFYIEDNCLDAVQTLRLIYGLSPREFLIPQSPTEN